MTAAGGDESRPAPQADRLSDRSVLVAEDGGWLGLMVAEVLEHSGMRVFGPVDSVAAALRTLASCTPDMALLGVRLGGVATDAIAEHLRGRRIPFVCATAVDAGPLPAFVRDAPVLRQPYSCAQLLAAMAGLPRRE